MDRKTVLRQQQIARRAHLSHGYVARASRSIVRQLRKLVPLRPGLNLGAYLPLANEPDIRPFLDQALRAGCNLTAPARDGDQWDWHRLPALPDKNTSPLAIRQQDLAGPLQPDIAIIPGLAFDYDGWRLGHGGGVYDRLLADAYGTQSVGVAFYRQLIERIPVDRWDQRVDAVVTTQGVVWTGSIALHDQNQKGAHHGTACVIAAVDGGFRHCRRRDRVRPGPKIRRINCQRV